MYNNYNNYSYGYNSNTAISYYVNSYNDILNTPVSTNGEASIFINLNDMTLYTKKIINGQSYIQGYTISPINNVGMPPENKSEANQNDALKIILDELESMKKDINLLKGAKPNE